MKTQMIGNVGCYVDDKNVVSFQVGAGLDPTYIGYKERNMHFFPPRFTNLDGCMVYSRGKNDCGCEQIEKDIKSNRLFTPFGQQANQSTVWQRPSHIQGRHSRRRTEAYMAFYEGLTRVLDKQRDRSVIY